MLDLGTGVAIAGVAVSVAAVSITVIKTRATTQDGREGHAPPMATCPVHHTVEAACKAIWDAIEIIQQDIKELLKR